MDLPKYAYFQGGIVPYSEAKVGVLTHALNYGTAAFAGLRAYVLDDVADQIISAVQKPVLVVRGK